MNWRGQPLTSHEVAVNLIAGTTTRTGLTVHAEPGAQRWPRMVLAAAAAGWPPAGLPVEDPAAVATGVEPAGQPQLWPGAG